MIIFSNVGCLVFKYDHNIDSFCRRDGIPSRLKISDVRHPHLSISSVQKILLKLRRQRVLKLCTRPSIFVQNLNSSVSWGNRFGRWYPRSTFARLRSFSETLTMIYRIYNSFSRNDTKRNLHFNLVVYCSSWRKQTCYPNLCTSSVSDNALVYYRLTLIAVIKFPDI